MTSLLLSLIMVLCFTFSNAKKLVPAVYVLGDSAIDVGNNNYLKFSLLKANYPHNGVDFPGKLPTGRYCNGKNVADFLAEKVGLVTSPPYLSLVSESNNGNAFPITGVSFASGGAGILNATHGRPNGTDELFRETVPLSKQVDYYSIVYEDVVKQLGSAGAQRHLSKSLFVFVFGNNDLLAYSKFGSHLPMEITPHQYVGSLLISLKQELKRMHDFGARKYMVVGAGPLGCIPFLRNQRQDGDCNEEANHMALKFNKGLKSVLQGLGSELSGFNYSFIDEYNLISSFIQTPSIFGFNEVKAACCGFGKLNGPCLPFSLYCFNRSDHLFWDVYHPTETAVRIIIDTCFDGSQKYTIPINIKQLVDA